MSRIGRLIQRLHHSIPPEIRKSYRFLVVFGRKARQLFLPVYHIECGPTGEHDPMKLVFVGWDKKLLYYWLSRFTSEEQRIRIQRRVPRWKMDTYLEKNLKDTDLIITESMGDRLSARLPVQYQLPRWIELQVIIEDALKKSRTRNIARNIRKYGMEYEVRNSRADFDLFYHRMYVPFVRSRHGESADIADYKHFAQRFEKEKPVLLFLTIAGEAVAGLYVEAKVEGNRLAVFGVLDAEADIYSKGVLGALYYFSFQYYLEQGEKSLLLGHSIPVAFDGVTEFKRQLGAIPFPKDLAHQKKYYFVPLNGNRILINALKSNPLIHLHNGDLKLTAFVRDEDFNTREEFMKYLKRLYLDQFDQSRLCLIHKSDQILQWIKQEELNHLEIISYK